MIRIERGRLVVGLWTPTGRQVAQTVLSAMRWMQPTEEEEAILRKMSKAIDAGGTNEPLQVGPTLDQWDSGEGEVQ